MPLRLPEELQYIQNSFLPQKSTIDRLDGKICLITGATSGIGLATAKLFAQKGAELLLLCRNEEKAEKLINDLKEKYGVTAALFLADFNRLVDVKHAAEMILSKYPRINILVNNAGVFNKRRVITPDGNEQVFQVVHLASFLLTQMLSNALEAGSPSRVIMVNSEAHRFGGLNLNDLGWARRPYIGLRAYGAAKIAQILTSLKMADQWKEKGVTVNLMHPGAVRTNIGMNNNFLYRLYSKYFLRWFLKDVNISANAIYYLAASAELANLTGVYYNLTNKEKPASYIIDQARMNEVWAISKSLTTKGELNA